MKLRTQIFLIAFALGILPILTLVAVNLSGHIQRHEDAGRNQTRTRLELRSENLNTAVEKRRQMLRMIGSLPEINSGLITEWLMQDLAVTGLDIQKNDGSSILNLAREDTIFTPTTGDHKTRPEDIILPYSTPAPSPEKKLILSLDPYLFLNQYKGAFWINTDGSYIHQPDDSVQLVETAGNAFTDFPGLKPLLKSAKPSIWENGAGILVGWIPLFLNSSEPSLWIGLPVDRTEARKWQQSLIQNIIFIILTLSAVIFVVAGAIAGKIDAIKAQIIYGLNRVLNHNEEFCFAWSGPKEITNMAEDLSKLAQRYYKNLQARKDAETELNENRENFLNLTNSAQDAIVFMDPEGNISFWNLAAEEIFGYSKDEATGKAIHKLISPRLPEDHTEPEQGKKDTEGPIRETIELITIRKDGTEAPVELSLSEARIRDRWHSIWIIRDISERRKAEKKEKQQQLQLIQADKMASLGLLVSGVAHEINNPNSISLLNTTMLARSWQSVSPILEKYYTENGDFLVAGLEYSEMREQIPRLFHELEESAKRIRSIVKDLKDYSRQDSTSHMDPVDLNVICEKAVRLTANLLKKSTDKFEFRPDNRIPQVKGHSRRLEQVVINLLQNSCDALEHPGASIMLETGSDGGNVFIRVTDEGCGIPSGSINKLTDPFFTTKKNSGGTGLGLSVSAGIIKEHNGTIDFRSQPGKGTTVTLSFPANNTER